ncbi:hypothetical protein T440DRAFT_507647 [Plenodomus tracheiphilus IPT5]|uniref:C3H1-type domain-containing protein n=1 Tax=Plenodomus tracheiphilus IPT5 TaxID=1408161 RepID=A0A6A7B6N1_9PLEO|nr:hypothetical protein T440DRAFT_507647 [Plenodomus tracheiphilus IPT5]
MTNRCCPRDKNQNGVCGCTEYWKHTKPPPTTQPSHTTKGTNNLRSPSPPPPGGPKQTCFFWYHDQCRRGDDCPYEHKTHITWPIVPPPGFVHFRPCGLEYCPLNANLALFNEQNAKEREESRLGGQGDGAFMSRVGSSEVGSGDDGEEVEDEVEELSASARPASSASEQANAMSGLEDAKEASAVNAPSVPESANTDPEAFLSIAPTPSTSHKKYFDMADAVSLPSASEVDDESVVLLGHAGAAGKRYRGLPSPETQRKRSRGELSRIDVGRRLELEIPLRAAAQEALSVPVEAPPVPTEALPVLRQPDPSHQLPPKPNKQASWTEPGIFDRSSRPSKPFNPPKGPRALSKEKAAHQQESEICFFYYHSGVCAPKRKRNRGRRRECQYSHTDPVPGSKVYQPHNITSHSVDCPLPLCPIRMAHQDRSQVDRQELPSNTEPTMKVELQDVSGLRVPLYPDYSYTGGRDMRSQQNLRSYPQAMELDDEHITREQRTPIKYESDFFETPASSSPREDITNARYLSTRGPMFNKYSQDGRALQLPKHTGLAKERFKGQKRRLENWQAHNRNKPESTETRKLNKNIRKQMRKDRNRQRRKELQRDATPLFKAEEDTQSLTYGGVCDTNVFREDLTYGRRQESPSPEARRFRTEFTSVILTPEAANKPDSSRYSLFPGPSMTPDIRDKRKDKSPSVETAMEDIQTMRMGRGRSRLLPTGEPVTEEQQIQIDHVRAVAKPVVKEYKVLVGYELPTSDNRLDWDTDLVRRTFGEIE